MCCATPTYQSLITGKWNPTYASPPELLPCHPRNALNEYEALPSRELFPNYASHETISDNEVHSEEESDFDQEPDPFIDDRPLDELSYYGSDSDDLNSDSE